MKSGRFAKVILLSSTASLGAYGVFALNRQAPSQRVKMRQTDLSEHSHTSLLSYSFLVTLLTQDYEAPAIFNAGLNRQENKLTHDQVIELAELAIKQNHAEELDMLSGAFPSVLTQEWMNQTLLNSGNRFLFSSLLYKHAVGKIQHLNYLFEPGNSVYLVEQSDKVNIAKASMFAHDRTMILIDSEEYDPSYRIETLNHRKT